MAVLDLTTGMPEEKVEPKVEEKSTTTELGMALAELPQEDLSSDRSKGEQTQEVESDGFIQKVKDFPTELGQAISDVGQRIMEPAAEIAQGMKEEDIGWDKELGSVLTETVPTMAYGLKDFLVIRPWLFASTGMISALESLGFMEETTPEMKKAWREDVSRKLSGGDRFEPTTPTSAITQGVLNEAFSVPVKFVESRMDSISSPEFQEKYPNLSDAIKWGGEFFAFGAIGKAGRRMKAIESKTGKARAEAETELFAKVEKALEKKPEVRDRIQELREFNQKRMAGAEGFSAINIQREGVPRTVPRFPPPDQGVKTPVVPTDGPIQRVTPPARTTPLGPEPRTATGQTTPIESTTPNRRVTFLSEEGIPRREFQISPDGKITETVRATQRKEFQVDSPGGKVKLVEKIPEKRKVYQILTDPIKNERGSIEIPRTRKEIEKLPSEVKENIRRLARVAVEQNKSFETFLKEAGFERKEIKRLKQLEEATRKERPFSNQTMRDQDSGKDPMRLYEDEVNVNVERGANGKTVISDRVVKEAQEAQRTVTPGIVQNLQPTLFGLEKFKAPFIKDLYHKVNAIERARIDDLGTLKDTIVDLRNKYPNKKYREEAFVKIMSQDQKGREALVQLGVEPIDGAIRYEGLVQDLKTQFDDLFQRINQTRVDIGKRPLQQRANYLPMIAQESIYSKLRKIAKGEKGEINNPNLVLDSVDAIDYRHSPQAMDATNFRHLRRRGLRDGVKLEQDPLKLLSQYGSTALRHIHYSPFNMFINQLTGNVFKDIKTGKPTWSMSKVNPEMHEFLSRWSNKLAGKPNVVHGPSMRLLESGMQKLSNNLTAAVLGWSIRTMLVQPTALIPTMTEFGFTPTVKGLMRTAMNSGKDPIKRSNVLATRKADAFINEIVDHKLSNKFLQALYLPKDKALTAMQFLDQVTATATWRTAYEAARKSFSEAQAIRMADEAVVRTQGSGFVGDLSPVQMNAVGKAVTLWQTFTINHMNWIGREILNIKHPERHPKETARRVFTYLTATALANSLFEDIMGIQSPQPAPIKEMIRAMDEGHSDVGVAYRGLLELTELMPVMSSLKFGASPAGAVAEFMNQLSDTASGDLPKALDGDKKAAKRVAYVGAKLLGFPGTQQIKRLDQGTPLGFPINKKSTGSRVSAKRRKRRSRRR